MATLKILAKYSGHYYELVLDDLFKAVPHEGRPGINTIYEASGRLKGLLPDSQSNISVFMAVYLYSDGKLAGEVAIYNDSMFAPLGITTLDWAVLYQGSVIFSEKNLILADQCGRGIKLGELKYAPRPDYDPTAVLPTNIKYTLPFPTKHVDPTTDTHTTGSPRNEFYDDAVAMYIKSGDRKWLNRLHDFALFQTARPYHLSDEDGMIFDHKKKYSSKKPVMFGDGKIDVPDYPAYVESFGRTKDPKFATLPTHPNGGPMNGGDLEHMTVDKLYHCYMTLGSRLARRELLNNCQWIANTYTFMNGDKHFPHSERVLGWTMKAWALGSDVAADGTFFDMMEQLIRQTKYFAKGDPIPFMVGSDKPDTRHLADQKFVCTWQAGIALHGLVCYIKMANKYNKTSTQEYQDAKQLINWGVAGILKYAYQGSSGCVSDYGIEFEEIRPNPQWVGTTQWIIAGLSDALDFITDTAAIAKTNAIIREGFDYWSTSQNGDKPTFQTELGMQSYFQSFIYTDKLITRPVAPPQG